MREPAGRNAPQVADVKANVRREEVDGDTPPLRALRDVLGMTSSVETSITSCSPGAGAGARAELRCVLQQAR
jgi:hypothetical protein